MFTSYDPERSSSEDSSANHAGLDDASSDNLDATTMTSRSEQSEAGISRLDIDVLRDVVQAVDAKMGSSGRTVDFADVYSEFQQVINSRSLTLETYPGVLRTHKALTRLQTYTDPSWSKRLDKFLEAYEKDNNNRMKLLKRSSIILVNRFKRGYFVQWLEAAQSRQDFHAQKMDFASQISSLSLCRKAFHRWVEFAETERDKLEYGDVLFEKKLLSRQFATWKAQWVQEGRQEKMAEDSLRQKFLQVWSQRKKKLRVLASNSQRFHDDSLRTRYLKQIWHVYCGQMAKKRYENQLLSKATQMWVSRTVLFYCEDVDARRFSEQRLLQRMFKNLAIRMDRLESVNESAVDFRLEHDLTKHLGIWRRELVTQRRAMQFVAQKQRKVSKAILRKWRKQTLAQMEAKEFQRYFALQSALKHWREATKIKRWIRVRNSTKALDLIQIWRLNLRGNAFGRYIDTNIAYECFQSWRSRARDEIRNVKDMQIVAISFRDRALIRMFFDSWRSNLVTQMDLEGAAGNVADRALRMRVLETIISKLNIQDDQYDMACLHYRQASLKWVLQQWKKEMKLRRVRYLTQQSDEVVASRNLALKEESFGLMLKRYRKLKRDRAAALDHGNQKLLQIRAVLFDTWYWRYSAVSLREAEVSETSDKVTLSLAFQAWSANYHSISDLEAQASQHFESLELGKQLKLLRMWRLRSLKLASNKRLADDLVERLNRKLLSVYFKNWMSGRIKQTSDGVQRESNSSPYRGLQMRSAPRLRLANLASPALRTPTRPTPGLPLTTIRTRRPHTDHLRRTLLSHATTHDEPNLE